MKPNTPAAAVVGNIAAGPTRFFVQKRRITPMLRAITGGQENQFTPPVKGLADRDDASGKYARKVGQNRRALERIAEIMQDEKQTLVKKHAERYPELEIVNKDTGETRPHPLAGQTTPVYATAQDGTPLFKKDRAGNDTEERVIAPDQYNLADPMAFQRDMKELLEEWVCIECPGFTEDETNAFKAIAPRIVDPLLDLEVGGPANATPEEQIAAIRATAMAYLDLADKLSGTPAAPAAETTEDVAGENITVEQDRSAP